MKRISPIRARAGDDAALQELKQSLQYTQNELTLAYHAFDYASDPDLTEACIYAIRSLQSRMDYLIKQIKEREACTAVSTGRRRTGWISG